MYHHHFLFISTGHAIFMQGSKMAHGVSPVMHAREPRLTLVNSYQSNNPFAKPATFYRTFKVRIEFIYIHLLFVFGLD